MNDRLRLIQYLYDECEDDRAFRRRVAEDDALRREYKRLQKTKEALDRRRVPSPEPGVVDQVVASAQEATNGATDQNAPEAQEERRGRTDRAARPPTRTWTRRLRQTSAAVALLLLVGIGWWAVPESTNGPAETNRPSETTADRVGEREGRSQAIPKWDDRDDLIQIHRRIELLQSQNEMDAWGADLQPASRP